VKRNSDAIKNASNLILVVIILLSSGCAGAVQVRHERALENITPLYRELINLPPPEQEISIAVYRTRDMTGQYEYHPTATTLSTAVTQGSTPMLIKALLDSGWFIAVERENLGNLLTEQRITKQKLSLLGRDPNIEKMLHLPEFIIEGGITEFNDDIITSGLGVRYFGVGPKTQARLSSVVIDLRLVRVLTGRILETVSVSKRLLSWEVGFGVFRYVKANRLLEIEAGITNNEPSHMAVREAMERGVMLLIARGVKANLWRPKDEKDRDFFLKLLEAESSERLISEDKLEEIIEKGAETTR